MDFAVRNAFPAKCTFKMHSYMKTCSCLTCVWRVVIVVIARQNEGIRTWNFQGRLNAYQAFIWAPLVFYIFIQRVSVAAISQPEILSSTFGSNTIDLWIIYLNSVSGILSSDLVKARAWHSPYSSVRFDLEYWRCEVFRFIHRQRKVWTKNRSCAVRQQCAGIVPIATNFQ